MIKKLFNRRRAHASTSDLSQFIDGVVKEADTTISPAGFCARVFVDVKGDNQYELADRASVKAVSDALRDGRDAFVYVHSVSNIDDGRTLEVYDLEENGYSETASEVNLLEYKDNLEGSMDAIARMLSSATQAADKATRKATGSARRVRASASVVRFHSSEDRNNTDVKRSKDLGVFDFFQKLWDKCQALPEATGSRRDTIEAENVMYNRDFSCFEVVMDCDWRTEESLAKGIIKAAQSLGCRNAHETELNDTYVYVVLYLPKEIVAKINDNFDAGRGTALSSAHRSSAVSSRRRVDRASARRIKAYPSMQVGDNLYSAAAEKLGWSWSPEKECVLDKQGNEVGWDDCSSLKISPVRLKNVELVQVNVWGDGTVEFQDDSGESLPWTDFQDAVCNRVLDSMPGARKIASCAVSRRVKASAGRLASLVQGLTADNAKAAERDIRDAVASQVSGICRSVSSAIFQNNDNYLDFDMDVVRDSDSKGLYVMLRITKDLETGKSWAFAELRDSSDNEIAEAEDDTLENLSGMLGKLGAVATAAAGGTSGIMMEELCQFIKSSECIYRMNLDEDNALKDSKFFAALCRNKFAKTPAKVSVQQVSNLLREGGADQDIGSSSFSNADEAAKFLNDAEGWCKTNGWKPTMVKLSKLPKGEYFTLKPVENPKESQVWVKDDYDKAERKYMVTKFSDIGASKLLPGSKEVCTGFTF